MIRLFKHYIPHAVILLGLIDLVLLCLAGEIAWRVRAGQIGIDAGETLGRLWQLSAFAAIILTAMIAVGVYGADALRSMRFATARLLVAISLGVIGLAFVDFLLGGHNFWRSTLAYTMAIAIVMLVLNRLVIGGLLGTAAFRRRCWCWGPGRGRTGCASFRNGRRAGS